MRTWQGCRYRFADVFRVLGEEELVCLEKIGPILKRALWGVGIGPIFSRQTSCR